MADGGYNEDGWVMDDDDKWVMMDGRDNWMVDHDDDVRCVMTIDDGWLTLVDDGVDDDGRIMMVCRWVMDNVYDDDAGWMIMTDAGRR